MVCIDSENVRVWIVSGMTLRVESLSSLFKVQVLGAQAESSYTWFLVQSVEGTLNLVDCKACNVADWPTFPYTYLHTESSIETESRV